MDNTVVGRGGIIVADLEPLSPSRTSSGGGPRVTLTIDYLKSYGDLSRKRDVAIRMLGERGD
jgi:hypothetical protein